MSRTTNHPALSPAAPYTVFALLFAPDGVCEFCVLDNASLSLYAESSRIGFVYARIAAGADIPDRLVRALEPALWAGTEPFVREHMADGDDVVVYTALVPGDTRPYIMHNVPRRTPDAGRAARDYLVHYGRSVLDTSLTRFSERVHSLASEFPDWRTRLLGGLVDIHATYARMLGLREVLTLIRDASGALIELQAIGDEQVLVRLGPAEITRLLKSCPEHVQWRGELPETFAQLALPQLPGCVYLHAQAGQVDGPVHLIVSLPDDSASSDPDYELPPLPKPSVPDNVIHLPVRPRPAAPS